MSAIISVNKTRRLEEGDESLVALNTSLFAVYISPALSSKDFLEEKGLMDQINISSWSASYSYDEETIYFSLQFENFAYISADSSTSDQVRIDFL